MRRVDRTRRVPALIATIGVALATTAGAPPASAAADPAPDPVLLQRMLDRVTATGVPAAMVEVRYGANRWSGASGVRDIRTGRAARPEERFRIASITKTMVSTVILQLVGEHRLRLDDPVQRHLPGLLPYSEEISVRQLLQHTSGLADYVPILFPDDPAILANRYTQYAPHQLVKIATARPLEFAPGTGFAYSNTGYVVAGMLIEKLTRRTLQWQLAHRVFIPAGMVHSSFPTRSAEIHGPHPRGYLSGWLPTDPITDVTSYNHSWVWAAGAVISTTSDVDRFYRALTAGTLLSPALLAELRTPDPIADGTEYGLGVMLRPMNCPAVPGGVVWGHNGATFGYLSFSLHTLDGRRQVTIATTLYFDPAGARALYDVMITALCGSPPNLVSPQTTKLPEFDDLMVPALTRRAGPWQ